MSTLRKWLLIGGALLIVAVGGVFLVLWLATFGARQEYREREAALKPLLQSHATREQVGQTLGVNFFVDYSVGSTNRWVIEQRVSDPGVRQRADRYPGVLFSTTMEWMTWLFFDSEGRLQDYYLCVQ
jgi:hypothetical protein